MGIIDRFQALFRPAKQNEPATLAAPPKRPLALSALFGAESDRASGVRDCRTMYDEDTRAKQAIGTLARDATKGGFQIVVMGPRAKEASAVATEMVERLHLFTRIDDWSRLTLRDGDSFLEVGAATDGTIVHVSRKPTLEMRRWSNEYDEFIDPMRAFFWTDQPWRVAPDDSTTTFAEWQMVHARYDRDEGDRYGTPLFRVARKPYKRMTQGELDIAVRRKTRAGMKYLHVIKDGGPAQIAAYMAANRPALDDPYAAIADIFASGDVDVRTIAGDARLTEIEDVLHHADTFAVASPVPLELIGYGRNINRDVLEQKKEQYEESIGAFRTWIEQELIRPLLERQWLLLGIWPDGLEWSVKWQSKRVATPAGIADLARAVVTLKAAGLLTDETLLRVLGQGLPDFDVAAELEALRAGQPDEIGRMAAGAGADDDDDEGDTDGD